MNSARMLIRRIHTSSVRKAFDPNNPIKMAEGFLHHEPPGNAERWKKMSLFMAVPIVAFYTTYLYMTMEEHERPPYIKYDWINVRRKKFFFGDGQRTLFHNPHTNALPDGYEDEH